MNVVIVGAGKIGIKRADALLACGDKIVGVVDHSLYAAENFSRHYGVPYTDTLSTVLPDADVVVISTPPVAMRSIALQALSSGKHVLCEKPFCMNVKEAREVVDLALSKALKIKVGFNHRYHPHIQKAHRLISEGVIGDVMYAKLTFGHGARIGYETEWWSNPRFIGGGCLMDGGSHALDLLNWFFGEPLSVSASVFNSYWATKPLEDNAFLSLLYINGVRVLLHTSITQWKNKFELEVYGSRGYVIVQGLGQSYGPERLIVAASTPGSAPLETIEEFNGLLNTFITEWAIFKGSVVSHATLDADGRAGLLVQQITEAAYKSSCSLEEVTI